MRLYTRTKRRLAANRLAGQMTNKYQRKQATRTAGQLGNGLSMIDGQLYNTGATNGHGTVAVVNLGRPAAAIYAPQTGGQITMGGGSGGGCSDGGGSGIGSHALDGPQHTGTLAQSQAPWAALDSDLQAHINDDNIHHDRLHSVISTDDHEVTAARYAVLGTPNAANALAMWTTSSNGTAGNALLRSDSNGAIYLNDLYAYDKVQSQSYTPGLAGSGYRLDYAVTNAAKSFLEVDDLSVRRRMTVRELLIRKIRTTNGDIFVTSGGEVESATDLGAGAWRLTFKEDHGFLEDDLIAAQAWTGSGVYRLEATVTSVATTKQLDVTLDDGGGDTPGTILAAGLSLSFARHGSTSDPDRQGVVYLSSDDTGAPFIRVLDGIDSWAAWTDPAALKVQMGRLDGISHAVLGDLEGYGLFGEAVYLTGTMTAGNGDAVMGDQGINIQAGTVSSGGWTNATDKISFSTDPMATLDAANTVGQIGAVQFVSGSEIHRQLAARVQAGTAEGTDAAIIELRAQYVDPEALVPIQYAGITMGANNGSPYITIGLQGDTSAAGNVYVTSPVTDFAGHIRMSGGGNIGTALAPVGTLYADELVVGTTYSENSGYVNDTRYMPRSELSTTLAAYALDGHEHAGLVTTADLTAELADYATTAYVDAKIAGIPAPDLSNYWTKAQADGRYTALTTYTAHVATANPHGTALADLAAKDYGDLTNRSHLLADASGLGPDHSISGATAGHVLRATGSSAARFMRLGATDLGITAGRYAVVGTPDAANQIGIWYPTSDGSAGYGLLMTDANGDLAVTDLAADAISAQTLATVGAISAGGDLTVDGSISSLDYVARVGGYYLSGDYAEFGNLHARGTFSSAVFEMESTLVTSGRDLRVKSSGTLAADLAIDNSGGTQYSVAVEYGSRDKAKPFAVGDILAIRGLAAYTTPTGSGDSATPLWDFFTPSPLSSGYKSAVVWLEVSAAPTDDGTNWIYSCEWQAGDDKITYRAGEAIADYGQAGDGIIYTAATGGHAPFMDIRTHNGSPWEDETTHVRIGQVGGITAVRAAANEWGFVAGTLTATGAYVALTDQQAKLHGVPFEMMNSYGDITGLWSEDGICMIAPINLQWQDLDEDEAIGGGAPDEDWYSPTYSGIKWVSEPGATSPDEYGAIRMMTRRAGSIGFGDDGYQSTSRIELSAQGHALVDGDSVITETAILAVGQNENIGGITVRAYDYDRSSGTEIEIEAGTLTIRATTTISALTLSGLRLNSFPTSEATVPIGGVYVDAGTLKVKTA